MATSLILNPELPLGLNGRRPGLPSPLLLGAPASMLVALIMAYLAISARDSASHRRVIIVHDKSTDRVRGVHGQLMSIAARLVEHGSRCLSSTCAVLGNPRVPFSHWGPTMRGGWRSC